jgi:hypothetical protein
VRFKQGFKWLCLQYRVTFRFNIARVSRETAPDFDDGSGPSNERPPPLPVQVGYRMPQFRLMRRNGTSSGLLETCNSNVKCFKSVYSVHSLTTNTQTLHFARLRTPHKTSHSVRISIAFERKCTPATTALVTKADGDRDYVAGDSINRLSHNGKTRQRRTILC